MSDTSSTTTDAPLQPQAETASPGLELLAPLLCLVGLCIATYLTILHYSLMLGDLSLGGVCGGGTWGDCNSVVASRYGKLLTLPVSVWGMWYYICAGALALALLNFAHLVIAGHPWSIAWGLTLWAAKAALWLGWSPETSGFWADGFPARALAAPFWRDTTSLVNLAIIAGAGLAAAIAGRFRPGFHLPAGTLVASIIGGLLLGYGARLAYGCNIGAFFSGLASQSLHGWVWILAAIPGTWIGIRLRPLFGLGLGGRGRSPETA